MKIKLPADPAIADYDARQAERMQVLRQIGEVSRRKEEARERFLAAQTDQSRALLDASGRDLSQAAFHKSQRELDESEVDLRMQLSTVEAEIEKLSRARNKAITAANRAAYVDTLRRRARALVEVAKLNDAGRAFHDGMRDLGVSGSLRPMAVGPVGNWSDNQSVAQFHVAELRENFFELTDEDFEG